MKFVCDECGTQYLISDEKIGPKGAKVRCKRCGNIIVVRPSKSEEPTADAAIAAMTEPQGRPLDEPGEDQERDELGQAFDQLLKGGLDAGEEDDDEDEGQATEIFSMEELQRQRSAQGIADEEQDKIDQVFSAAASTDVGQLHSGREESAREEWYVAISDEQVGPMGLGEVENRWEAGEITPDSLAWHPGMQDWTAVKDVPKLRYLLGSMKKEEAPPAAVEAGDSFSAKVSDEWDTSGGSALSSLVEEEIESIESEPPPKEDLAAAPEDEILGEDDVPPWEREEVVSGEVARPSESYFDSTLDSPTTDSGAPYSSRRSGFSRPAYLSDGTQRKPKTKLIVMAAVAAVVIAGSVIAIFSFSGGKNQGGPGDVQPIERPQHGDSHVKSGKSGANSAGTHDGGTVADGGTAAKSGQTAGDKAKKPNEGVLVVKKVGTTPVAADSSEKQPNTHEKHNGKTGTHKRRKRKRKKVAVNSGQNPKPKPHTEVVKHDTERGSLPATLSKAQIFGTMKKYLGAMKGCVKQQKQRNPSVTGTMLVSFVIKGSGKATDVRIISKEHQGTYVAGCMTYLIKNMKFPKFSGTPIPIPRIPLKLGD